MITLSGRRKPSRAPRVTPEQGSPRYLCNAPRLVDPSRSLATRALSVLLRAVRGVRDAPALQRPLLQERLRADDPRPDPLAGAQRPAAGGAGGHGVAEPLVGGPPR